MNTHVTEQVGMRTENADNLEQLRELIQEACDYLTPKEMGECELWYRGHDSGTHTLTPSLFRYLEPDKKERILFNLYAEYVGNTVGHIPNSWAQVAWMQHFGIPTRLLDWTVEWENAVFFAVKFLAGKAQGEKKPDDLPCIYVLNPLMLNMMSERDHVPHVPSNGTPEFGDLFLEPGAKPMEHALAVVPVNDALNSRLKAQHGRFTVHGSLAEPLEHQSPRCLFRINFSRRLCSHLCGRLGGIPNVLSLFPPVETPDPLGITQFVASKANLVAIPYNHAAEQIVRNNIETLTKERRNLASKHSGSEDYGKHFGSCNLGKAYISRQHEADALISRLWDGPSFIFVVGEAGIGKTNFILENLLNNDELKNRLSVFCPLKLCATIESAELAAGSGGLALMEPVYKLMAGQSKSPQVHEVARQMIRDGRVILALDGLDELARNQGQEAVKALVYELESLVAGSQTARIIVSCRDHVFRRLQETGYLGRSNSVPPIRIKRFAKRTMQKRLVRELGRDSAKLASLAETPLLYQMIRSAKAHLPRLIAADQNTARLQEAWFKVMLDNDLDALSMLSWIAAEMLKRRSDVLEMKAVPEKLVPLVDRLSKPPFVLFTEEEKQGTFTFSHQSLREFVLAWRVYQEITTGEFVLLAASPSFDYEGGEFHARVGDLIGNVENLERYIIRRLDDLAHSPTSLGEEEWNHLVRNLFEILGELMPDNDGLAVDAVRVALQYLNVGSNLRHYVTYKTRYNVARCLERIHPDAPRPYNCHTLAFHTKWDMKPQDASIVGGWAIRGFHLTKQEPRPVPPTVFLEREAPPGLSQLEVEVTGVLMHAIEGMTDRELPEDAVFFGINCTHALIRWLPECPDLNRIQKLLADHPHVTNEMRQNVFWALYKRNSTNILDCFEENDYFAECGPLSSFDGKSIACEEALIAYRKLLPKEGGTEDVLAAWRMKKQKTTVTSKVSS